MWLILRCSLFRLKWRSLASTRRICLNSGMWVWVTCTITVSWSRQEGRGETQRISPDQRNWFILTTAWSGGGVSGQKHQSNVCNLFCFSVSSGLEDVTPCGLPLVSPSPSPLAWTTLRGCLLEHTLWYVLITEETWVDSILCFYKRQEASTLFLVDIKNWSGLGVRLLGMVRMQYGPNNELEQLTDWLNYKAINYAKRTFQWPHQRKLCQEKWEEHPVQLTLWVSMLVFGWSFLRPQILNTVISLPVLCLT